jgi:predicted Ser/Thr protein kinase
MPPWPDANHEQTVVRRTAGAQPTLPVGAALINGTYVIEEFLARGGMGEVYRARHSDHGTQHAIKVILPSLARDPTVAQLFIREARELGRINNDAIVQYQGFLRDERGARYLVMEFVEGDPLSTILRRDRLETEEVLTLLDRIGGGLAAAHALGIVHRDISPENIIVPGRNITRAKLIDFGIAKSADPGNQTLIGSDFAGKFSFVSPEQAGLFGTVVDNRSDIYSLGLVLAAGALGFGKKLDMGTTPATVVQARQRVPDLDELAPRLRPLIEHMLQPRPQDRPSSMPALIEEAHRGPPGKSRPAGAATVKPAGASSAGAKPAAPSRASARGGRKIAVWAGAAALALLIAAGGALLWPQLAAPSVETLRATLAATASGYRCADLSYALGDDRVMTVSGFVASDQDRAGLRSTVSGLSGVSRLDFDVGTRAWPYCEALALLKPVLAGGARGPAIGLEPRAVEVHPGSPLALDVRMPDFDGYVYIDYFQPNGEVLHLLPNDKDPISIKPARNHFVLGRPPMRGCWVFAREPGEHLVTLVVSKRPLFSSPPRDSENAKDYLPRLSRALADAPVGSRAAVALSVQVRPGSAPAGGDGACRTAS